MKGKLPPAVLNAALRSSSLNAVEREFLIWLHNPHCLDMNVRQFWAFLWSRTEAQLDAERHSKRGEVEALEHWRLGELQESCWEIFRGPGRCPCPEVYAELGVATCG